MILITDILRQIRKGVGVTEASEQARDVIKACMATGKPGEVTIKLKFTSPVRSTWARSPTSTKPWPSRAASVPPSITREPPPCRA